jgi:hypothetical protein
MEEKPITTKQEILAHLDHFQMADLLAEIADDLGVGPPGEHNTTTFIARLPKISRDNRLRAELLMRIQQNNVDLARM